MKKILVYGSLREGMYNFNAFKKMYPEIKKVKTTILKGWDLFSLGAYPAIYPSKDISKKLVVDLLEVPENAYKSIYNMEIGAGYHEVDIILEDKTRVPLYVYNSNKFLCDENLVQSGDWIKFKMEKEEILN